MTLAYKVVKIQNNKMISIVVSGMASLEYELNTPVEVLEWLKNANLYPFLFDTKRGAIEFIKNISAECLVLECECESIVNCPRYCNIIALNNGRVHEYNIPSWPAGTVSYKAITPVKIVYNNQITE